MTVKKAGFQSTCIKRQCGQIIRPRLFILSNVRLMCEGLTLALSHQPTVAVVGSSDLPITPTRIAELRPDVLLLDIAIPGSLNVSLSLRETFVHVKIVAFAVSELELVACAEAGLSGYISREGSVEDVVAAVHHAMRGELLCSPRAAALLFGHVAVLSANSAPAAGEKSLTRREREIAALIEKGLPNKEIARLLRIEAATVKNHVHNLLTKLQVRRRGEAATRIRQDTTQHPGRISFC
jgi:two-component system, NarL family, nitrate/nitrite response regulator NarL